MERNPPSIEIVSTAAGLAEAAGRASAHSWAAIDIESNGFHRYPEHICLVQLAVPGSVHLIDPLAIADMTPLGSLLANRRVEKVMHSADYDLRSLDRDWGFHAASLFDTSIASAFLGSAKLGLSAVLKEHLGIELTKTKSMQRSDWTRRPLSDESREYAAADVRHLVDLREKLAGKLTQLSRLEWVQEECERLTRVRNRPPDPEWAFLSTKGRSALDARGLGVLRSLHRFREQEALNSGLPPFKIISNTALVHLAASPERDLTAMSGLGRYGRGPAMGRLRSAIRDGLSAGPLSPPVGRRTDAAPGGPAERDRANTRLKKLKDWRAAKAAVWGIDPSLVWPSASLERLARLPQSLEADVAGPEVRAWQTRELGPSLRTLAASL